MTIPHKNTNSLAAVILAAGESKRMGRPKALLPLGDKTFVEKLIFDYHQVGCRPVIVVLGNSADRIRPTIENLDILIQINPDPQGGLLSSLQIGLDAIPSQCTGFFFCLVDHPAISVETLQRMIKEWHRNTELAVRPRFENRGGHPVLMGCKWIEPILALPHSSNMRRLLHEKVSEVIDLPVSDPGILIDIDTPADYQRFLLDQRNK